MRLNQYELKLNAARSSADHKVSLMTTEDEWVASDDVILGEVIRAEKAAAAERIRTAVRKAESDAGVVGQSEALLELGLDPTRLPDAPADDTQNTCFVCSKAFERQYSEDEERWVFKACLPLPVQHASKLARAGGKPGRLLHWRCLQLVLRPPTRRAQGDGDIDETRSSWDEAPGGGDGGLPALERIA